MKYIILSFAALLSLPVFADCPSIPWSQNYSINESFLTIGSDFDIKIDDQKVGSVIQRTLNLGKTFELFDRDERLVAKAQEEVFSWGVKINAKDCEGNPIGGIQEDVLESILGLGIQTVYTLMDANQNPISKSKKLELIGTDITLYNLEENTSVELTRSFIGRSFFSLIPDSWTLKVIQEKNLDLRTIFFIAAYKTSADKERK